MFSYGGSVLRVDLTEGEIDSHPTEEGLARTYLGGRGLNVKRLWDELPAGVDGMASENLLVLGVGPPAPPLRQKAGPCWKLRDNLFAAGSYFLKQSIFSYPIPGQNLCPQKTYPGHKFDLDIPRPCAKVL